MSPWVTGWGASSGPGGLLGPAHTAPGHPEEAAGVLGGMTEVRQIRYHRQTISVKIIRDAQIHKLEDKIMHRVVFIEKGVRSVSKTWVGSVGWGVQEMRGEVLDL